MHTGPPTDPGIHGSLSKRPEPVVGSGRLGYECTVAVEDLAPIRAAIVANGGEIMMEEYEIVGVGRMIRFRDCEGNVACAMRYTWGS
jgi:predicted enzyme related to lactoylglutathione lyase